MHLSFYSLSYFRKIGIMLSHDITCATRRKSKKTVNSGQLNHLNSDIFHIYYIDRSSFNLVGFFVQIANNYWKSFTVLPLKWFPSVLTTSAHFVRCTHRTCSVAQFWNIAIMRAIMWSAISKVKPYVVTDGTAFNYASPSNIKLQWNSILNTRNISNRGPGDSTIFPPLIIHSTYIY